MIHLSWGTLVRPDPLEGETTTTPIRLRLYRIFRVRALMHWTHFESFPRCTLVVGPPLVKRML
jgi:hypothetical protein